MDAIFGGNVVVEVDRKGDPSGVGVDDQNMIVVVEGLGTDHEPADR